MRELFEECGLSAKTGDLEFAADLYFSQPSDPRWSHGGMVYFLRKWKGEPRGSDEMEPRWFKPGDLPYEDMWEADKIWFSMILSGRKIKGTVWFAEDGDHVTGTEFFDINE